MFYDDYGPLVKWLRHLPFTEVTGVRVPYGSFFLLYLAVVVERQTHHLEGVALTRREGSNPSDRIPILSKKPLLVKGFFVLLY
ncbi:MAG: hypothetical protein K0Q73_4058 [Paenibacillus sp.]|nr:hypothetical protein [Paenibacillus sp.]